MSMHKEDYVAKWSSIKVWIKEHKNIVIPIATFFLGVLVGRWV